VRQLEIKVLKQFQ